VCGEQTAAPKENLTKRRLRGAFGYVPKKFKEALGKNRTKNANTVAKKTKWNTCGEEKEKRNPLKRKDETG